VRHSKWREETRQMSWAHLERLLKNKRRSCSMLIRRESIESNERWIVKRSLELPRSSSIMRTKKSFYWIFTSCATSTSVFSLERFLFDQSERFFSPLLAFVDAFTPHLFLLATQQPMNTLDRNSANFPSPFIRLRQRKNNESVKDFARVRPSFFSFVPFKSLRPLLIQISD
jgi:hypothetical protein